MTNIKRNMRHRQSDATKEVKDTGIKQVLVDQGLEKYAERATIIYGTEVLEDRAVPDYRDGLKPVQRAILWAMYNLNLHHSGPYKKAARVVGEVIGSYHPHGDCLHGDTKIPLLNGKTITIRELSKSKSGSRWVLSFDEKTGNVIPSLAHSWRIGQSTRTMVRLHLSTGEIIEGTKNHPFYSLTRNKWISLENLKIGEELAGGSFTYGTYTCVKTNTEVSRPIHHIVGDFNFNGLEEGEVYHHIDEDTHNNKPSNIQVLTKAEHAELHGDYLIGLANGRNTMFNGTKKYRKAIKEKNSALLKAYNESLWLLKALKAYRLLVERGLEINSVNYESLRKEIYNLTKLATLKSRGISLSNLCELNGVFHLDTSKAKGLTANLRRLSEVKISRKQLSNILGCFYKAASYAFKKCKGKFTWSRYCDNYSKSNLEKTLHTDVNFIKTEFGVKNAKDFATHIPGYFLTVVTDIEFITLDQKEDFYDFTVEDTANMIVLTSNGETTGNFVIAHNSSTYQAMVNMVNSPEQLVDGYGNWGSHVEDAAAYRYCFTAGTRIMTSLGLVNIEHIPKLFGFHENPNRLHHIRIDLDVASSGVSAKATKWLYSGRHRTYRVTTKLGYSVQCTINEPFMQIDSDLNHVWTPLDKLKVGDHVCVTGLVSDLKIHETGVDKQHAYMLAILSKAKIEESRTIYYSDYINGRFNGFKNTITRFADSHGVSYDLRLEDREDKNIVYITCEDQLLNDFGIYDWNEYTSYIPSVIFQSSIEAATSYMFGIFTMYTKIIDTEYCLSSRSRALLNDSKLMLLNYFGIVTGPVVESENGFMIMIVYDIEGCIEQNLIHHSTVTHYKQALSLERIDLNKIRDYDIVPFAESYINNSYVDALTNSDLSENDLQKIRVLSKHYRVLDRQLDFKSLPDTEVIDRLCKVLDKNYTYDIITSIDVCEEQDVFDLTVEGTHAFVANGFVVHNTEARLSKYSDLYLLDPEYLAVTDMRPNYSEDRMMPTVLPAKVPNMLLIGNSSIAVGISASSPPFEAKGVIGLSILCLSGAKLTRELCLKYLKFNYKYGGKCLSPKQDLLNFYESGKGTLEFEPDYTISRREFIITSTCPGLNSQNSIQKLLDNLSSVPGVKLVYDNEDKGGIQYVVQFGKISEEKRELAIVACQKLVRRKERYDMGAVERLPETTNFMRLSPMQLIENWCVWRTEIERKVITNRILKCDKQLRHFNLMVLAVDNLKTIIESLSKTDSEQYLMQKLKIDKDDADTIMDMKVRQLKKLEKQNLVERIKTEQSALKAHKTDLKKPESLIIESLKKLI